MRSPHTQPIWVDTFRLTNYIHGSGNYSDLMSNYTVGEKKKGPSKKGSLSTSMLVGTLHCGLGWFGPMDQAKVEKKPSEPLVALTHRAPSMFGFWTIQLVQENCPEYVRISRGLSQNHPWRCMFFRHYHCPTSETTWNHHVDISVPKQFVKSKHGSLTSPLVCLHDGRIFQNHLSHDIFV